jgi:hypothetical protein
LAAGAQDIHHAIHDSPHVRPALAAAASSGRDQRLDIGPFVISQVARISQVIAVIFRPVLVRPHWGPLPRIKKGPSNPSDSKESRSLRTDTKAWYEFHINEALFLAKSNCSIQEAARAGRLVEQYYWKFILEKAAKRGVAIEQAASLGGQGSARIHKSEQRKRQAAANQLWQKHPGWTKTEVAKALVDMLDLKLTAKNVARFLKAPKKSGANARHMRV